MTQRELQLIAQRDFCYYALRQQQIELSKQQTPLEQAIDDATGYSDKLTQIAVRQTIFYIICLIRYKRELGEPFEFDYEQLQQAKKLKH